MSQLASVAAPSFEDAGTVTFIRNKTSNMTISLGFNQLVEPNGEQKFKDAIVLPIKPGKKVMVCSDGIDQELDYENFESWTKNKNVSQEHSMIKEVETRNLKSTCPFQLGFQVGHQKNAQTTDLASNSAYTFMLGAFGESVAPHTVYRTDNNSLRNHYFSRYGDLTPEKLYDNIYTGERTFECAGLVHTTTHKGFLNVSVAHPLIPVLLRTALDVVNGQQVIRDQAVYDNMAQWYKPTTNSFEMPREKFVESVETMITNVLVHFKTDKISNQNLTISRPPVKGARLFSNNEFTVPSQAEISPAFNDTAVGFVNPIGLSNEMLISNKTFHVSGHVDIKMDMLVQEKVDVSRSDINTFPKLVDKLFELHNMCETTAEGH